MSEGEAVEAVSIDMLLTRAIVGLLENVMTKGVRASGSCLLAEGSVWA